jgi:hypothetical protein
MWEVRAASGRLDELVDYVRAAADPAAQIFRSGEPDERVVVIDPSGIGVPDVPRELIARPPHLWSFDEVARCGLRVVAVSLGCGGSPGTGKFSRGEQ